MENLEISYCPYRTVIDNKWSNVQTAQYEQPVLFAGTVQTSQYTEPVFFKGSAKGLALLEDESDTNARDSKYPTHQPLDAVLIEHSSPCWGRGAVPRPK